MVERPGQEQAEASQPSLHSLVQTTVSLSLFQQGRSCSFLAVSDCVVRRGAFSTQAIYQSIGKLISYCVCVQTRNTWPPLFLYLHEVGMPF